MSRADSVRRPRPTGFTAGFTAQRARRRRLLWQLADLFGQVAKQRLFWGVLDPDTYGGYLDWETA